MENPLDHFKKYLTPLTVVTYMLDDDEDIIDLFKDVLKENGIENVQFFSRGTEFMEKMSEDVHICVVDHFLNNGVTGYEVLEKAIEENPEVIKIVVSGIDDKNIILRYVNDLEINQWIPKDIEGKYLVRLVEYINKIVPALKKRYKLMESVIKWKLETT